MNPEEKLISFKEWMAQNNRAYYARHAPGKTGDFLTSPTISAAFGGAIARQILEMDAQLGRPEKFFALEFGGGQGRLALDILLTLYQESPDFFSRFFYGMSDFPEALTAFQKKLKKEIPEISKNLRLLPPFGKEFKANLPDGPGCIIANEFLDALPVHLVVKRGGDFKEIFIAEKAGTFEIVELPPSSEVQTFIQAFPFNLEDGQFAEINLEMKSWLRAISSFINRGFALVLDYGGPREELYSSRYPEGTLRGFKQHRLTDVFTLQLGEGDWTADIDFSTLAKVAVQEGFSITGFSTQSNFLLGTGIAERLPSFQHKKLDMNLLKEHLAMKFLFHPEGIGNAFNVLGLHKGITPAPTLSGFRLRQEKL